MEFWRWEGRGTGPAARPTRDGVRDGKITAEQVKQLRDKTGAGMMECKAALTEANGNIEEADHAPPQARPRAGGQARRTRDGAGHDRQLHPPGRQIGVLVEVNCESDFVARTDDFNNLVKEVAMHIAAADPKWVRREDVPAEAIEKEKAIYRAQMESSGKPANVLDKIVEGKLGSFYSQFVLLDQPSIRDGSVTIAQIVARPAPRPARTSRSAGSCVTASAKARKPITSSGWLVVGSSSRVKPANSPSQPPTARPRPPTSLHQPVIIADRSPSEAVVPSTQTPVYKRALLKL